MSTDEKTAPTRLDAVENARRLLDEWVQALAQVLESMTDQKPEVRWQAAPEPLAAEGTGPEAELLWWKQPFPVSPGAIAWVAAPHATWEYAGRLTLHAAGLEEVEAGEAKNTWFEILAQSLAAMARSIGAILGKEVTCGPGVEQAPDMDAPQRASISLTFAEKPDMAPLVIALSPDLVALISAPGAEPAPQPDSAEKTEPRAGASGRAEAGANSTSQSRTMDLLLDVDLPVSISFGKAQLLMKDVLKLTTGSIIELNRGINEPVEVLVNHSLIARGEVVVVDGNYGVRIQEIANRQDLLRSLP
ncbi:MAG: flagellar motor switch protein FliN [Acidobacteriia bacterium]|nr:flagellar motor switch protein FliN [Terriglobia bacterium]